MKHTFSVYQNTLEVLDEIEITMLDRADFEEFYFDLQASLLNFRDHLKDVQKCSGNNSTNVNSIKLPKISLLGFTRNLTEWIPFYSTFNSSVNNKKQVDDLSKFHYLRSSLSNQALCSIQLIKITVEN